MSFTHLHVHSSYSTGDGVQDAGKIASVIKKRNMSAVALTDHGTMAGIPAFVAGCRAEGVKPIIGNEMYIAFGSASVKAPHLLGSVYSGIRNGGEYNLTPNRPVNGGHILLLSKNAKGYANLCKLNTYANEHGMYKGKPRIDLDALEKYSEGLIATTGCMNSVLAHYWRRGLKADASTFLKRMVSIFGKDNFFFEVQAKPSEAQRYYQKEWVIPLSQMMDIPLVLTSDAHHADLEGWELRTKVQCSSWKKKPHELQSNQDTNSWLYDEQFARVLLEREGIPLKAISNTQIIADKVDGDYYESAVTAPPLTYNSLTPEDTNKLLRKFAFEGLSQRLGVALNSIPPIYTQRLEKELEVIGDRDYSSYMLIVRDYILAAKELKIPVGPGRGSSGGSLLAWALQITGKQLDPIKHGLYFERFLNEGRVKVTLNFCS